MKRTEHIAAYEAEYLNDYGFESECVRARQQIVLELIREIEPRTVVEVGCGIDLIFPHVNESTITRWVIVEPAVAHVEAARDALSNEPRCSIVAGFLEESEAEIRAWLPNGADLVLCSSLLHEIGDSSRILESCKALLSSSGMFHVNVPNVLSFHRRLARAMGLIKSEYEPSQRNVRLDQPHLFDRATLRALLESNGFEVVSEGGYLIKPFTHTQMESIKSILTEDILRGLWLLGREHPELACEIFVNARRCA